MFQITPNHTIIPSNDSVLYECRFQPNFKEQLYYKIMTAHIILSDIRIQSDSNSGILALIDVSLRLIGKLFVKKSHDSRLKK